MRRVRKAIRLRYGRIPAGWRAAGLLTAALLLTLAVHDPAAAATAEADTLKVGERAPDFEIPATVPIPEDGSTVSIQAITAQGKSVVLAFFPKAFTGG